MFVDQVKFSIKAGNGGNGIVSFRREKFVEFGGPYGGSGGRGGNVVFEVDESLNTLLDYSYNKKYEADNGENGKTKIQNGKNAKDLILKVPPGTVIYDQDTNDLLADLTNHQEQFIAAYGGRGGRGNHALAKAGKQSLEICENGEPGDEKNLRLELKVLADVGFVGLPSVGKSTLISMMSRVKPKIAAYEFTTLTPNLGVCKPNQLKSFVIADLPGLIKGASLGKGLGHQFLRHIERTKIIAHIVDMSRENPIKDFETINEELKSFNENLLKKKMIVIANKMDQKISEENLKNFKNNYDIEVIPISAIQNSGIEELKDRLSQLVEETNDTVSLVKTKKMKKIYRFVDVDSYDIEYDEEEKTYYVTGPKIEKLIKMTNFSTHDNVIRFINQIKAIGIYAELEERGIKEGDVVNICGYEFEYID